MKSSRVTQVGAGRCAALDLQTLGCEMMQGVHLSDTTGFHWETLQIVITMVFLKSNVLCCATFSMLG